MDTTIQNFDVMDNRTAWILFILTMIIYSATFVFLHTVADRFKRFMSPTGGDIDFTIPVEPVDDLLMVHTQKTHTPSKSASMHASGMYYQELHQTLDVSVFR
jgi:hypothetical protein